MTATCIHVHIVRTCMYTYVHMLNIYARTRPHVSIVVAKSYTHVDLYVHMYMYMYIQLCTPMMYKCKCTCTCVYMYTTRAHTLPHAQTGSSLVDSDSHHFHFHSVPHHQQTTSVTPISSSPHNRSLPQPIGHPPERTGSAMSEGVFQKAPGAEVKSRSFEEDGQVCVCAC